MKNNEEHYKNTEEQSQAVRVGVKNTKNTSAYI
jgi:hypothetical protein